MPNFIRITPRQVLSLIRANPNAIILDVRTHQEYKTGYIPSAICLPDSSIKAHANRVIPNKNALIIVYCKGGSRSANACKTLASMGYTNVYDLGGINSWPYEIVSP